MPIQNKKLAEKISSMAATDQKWRKLAINDSNNKRLIKKVYECDGKNIAETKKIIEKYGWPTFELVGKRASNSFWLLIQHADRDLKFQKECLALLKQASKRGQIKLSNVAYLTDRIRVAENKKIIYGTQYILKDKKFVIRPVIDPKNLDKRRKQYGMSTIAEQNKKIESQYKKLLKDKLAKQKD